jgi:hypothetical protein
VQELTVSGTFYRYRYKRNKKSLYNKAAKATHCLSLSFLDGGGQSLTEKFTIHKSIVVTQYSCVLKKHAVYDISPEVASKIQFRMLGSPPPRCS